MRIIAGTMEAHYQGRGDTKLDPYDRILIMKDDGSVSVHSDQGFKPLNYMAAVSEVSETRNAEGHLVLKFSSARESLEVVIHEIHGELSLLLGPHDPGHSIKKGTELQLQNWLAENLTALDADLSFVAREYQTGDGPVDLLGERADGALAPIEVKRVASMGAVGQVLRYVEAMRDSSEDKTIVGYLAAVEFKEKTLELAQRRGVIPIHIPANWNGEPETTGETPS